jgi:hypothetical protein
MLRVKFYIRINKQMSSKTAAIVMPTKGGEPLTGDAVEVKPMAGGGLALAPAPLSGGRRRKSRRMTKKMLKMIKGMPKSKLAKLMKGGEGEVAEGSAEVLGGRKRKGKKTARKSRRHGLLY